VPGRLPARATGKSLNPRQIIHAIKTNLLVKRRKRSKTGSAPVVPWSGETTKATISDEAIWAATTCGACLAACPVCIEADAQES